MNAKDAEATISGLISKVTAWMGTIARLILAALVLGLLLKLIGYPVRPFSVLNADQGTAAVIAALAFYLGRGI